MWVSFFLGEGKSFIVVWISQQTIPTENMKNMSEDKTEPSSLSTDFNLVDKAPWYMYHIAIVNVITEVHFF